MCNIRVSKRAFSVFSTELSHTQLYTTYSCSLFRPICEQSAAIDDWSRVLPWRKYLVKFTDWWLMHSEWPAVNSILVAVRNTVQPPNYINNVAQLQKYTLTHASKAKRTRAARSKMSRPSADGCKSRAFQNRAQRDWKTRKTSFSTARKLNFRLDSACRKQNQIYVYASNIQTEI